MFKQKSLTDDSRDYVYRFETWQSRCPKTIEDYDDDRDLFLREAYERVWKDPGKQLGEFMT